MPPPLGSEIIAPGDNEGWHGVGSKMLKGQEHLVWVPPCLGALPLTPTKNPCSEPPLYSRPCPRPQSMPSDLGKPS